MSGYKNVRPTWRYDAKIALIFIKTISKLDDTFHLIISQYLLSRVGNHIFLRFIFALKLLVFLSVWVKFVFLYATKIAFVAVSM